MLLGGGGCCMSKCSFIILHCSVSHTTRTNTLPLLTPLGGVFGFIYIHIYTHFFQESLLSSFMSLPVHTFGKMPFDHSFLSKGTDFSVFFKSFFFHSSLLYQSMLLGGGGCWMSKCSFIILHCSVSHTDRTNTLPLLTPLGEDCFL